MEAVLKTVVFVGGGYSTATVLSQLLKKKIYRRARIILIDPKDGFYHSVGAPRAIFNKEFAVRSFAPYHELWDESAVTHIRAKIVSFNLNSVELSDGQSISFDILGAEWGTGFQLQAMERQRENLRAAHNIVVVGGGATGVETAAEAKEAFPDKNVALLHAGSRLLDKQKEVSVHDSRKVLNKLIHLGVDVQLNTKYKAAGSEASTAVLMCIGGTPNTSYLANDMLDEKGFVRTDAYLRLVGSNNIFAMGDIVSGYAPNLKTVYLHAPIIVTNARRLLEGNDPNKKVGRLSSFIDSVLIVTIGRHDSYAHGLISKFYAPQKRADFLTRSKIEQFAIAL